MLSSMIFGVASLLLAGIFAVALWHKLSDRQRFTAQFSAYDIVPSAWSAFVVWILIIAELAVVAGLLTGASKALLLAMGLLVIYTAAIVINLLRGRTRIDCGCGGASQEISSGLVARNVTLSLLAGSVYWLAPTGLTNWVVGLVCLGLASIGLLLYLATEQLLANQEQARRMRAPHNMQGTHG